MQNKGSWLKMNSLRLVKTIKCPECYNYMNVTDKVNSYNGFCNFCKSIIYSKFSAKEKIIKISKKQI